RPDEPGARPEAADRGRRQARSGRDARAPPRRPARPRRARHRTLRRVGRHRRGRGGPHAGGGRGRARGPRGRAGGRDPGGPGMNAGTHDDQHAHKARLLRRAKRAVVKIGSNVLAGTSGLRRERVRALAGEIAALAAGGRQVVVVSSGAVAAGTARLAGSGRSRSRIEWRQAAAAVGQIGLMAAYERAFAAHDRHVAQVLLTHADLADRRRYLNARHTLRALLDLGIVPIVNENDTVAVEELAFGDNDNLSALTASLVEADLLVILSDVEGLHTRDPRLDPDAPLVRVARAQDESVARAAGPAKGGRSLLPSGVRGVVGGFGVGDCVRCLGPDGREFARGLVNYGAAELEKIKGAHTRDIERLLGYKGSDEVIHRDDLVLLGGAE